MSSRRFELILRFLHLNDSDKQPRRDETGHDKMYKLQPFLELVVKRFKESYIPAQRLSIDESIIGFKGRRSFLQYLPRKPHKWGMKTWVLADSSNGYTWGWQLWVLADSGNGYTWGWQLYTGKEDSCGDRGLAHHVVVQLVGDPRLEEKAMLFTAITSFPAQTSSRN